MLKCVMGEQVIEDEGLKGFASRLKVAREIAGLTPYRLGKMAGLSDTAIYLIEAGSRMPSLDTAVRLARALGMTTSELLGETEPPERVQDEMERLAARLTGRRRAWAMEVLSSAGDFSEDELRILLDLMRSMAAKSKPAQDDALDTEPPEIQERPQPAQARRPTRPPGRPQDEPQEGPETERESASG